MQNQFAGGATFLFHTARGLTDAHTSEDLDIFLAAEARSRNSVFAMIRAERAEVVSVPEVESDDWVHPSEEDVEWASDPEGDDEPVDHGDALNAHLDENADEIDAQAKAYAKTHGISFYEARREIEDEYRQGYYDDVEARRTTDWDYGRE